MKRVIWLALFVCMVLSLWGKIRLPSILGDNMVLQRSDTVNIWGWAAPSQNVTVKPSWDNRIYTTKAENNGKWLLQIQTPEAGGPYQIDISDGESLTLKDILIGEVWICSGQSNMEMPVHGFYGQPVVGSLEEIVEASQYPDIRMFTLPPTPAAEPQDDCRGSWLKSTPESVRDFSAVGYFFGKNLNKVLNIPIGLITPNCGGIAIEPWMTAEAIRETAGINQKLAFTPQVQTEAANASYLFNGMIAPIRNFTGRGFIWYQGESNRKAPALYRKLQPLFVQMLREAWGQGELPFYYVQIAPFEYDGARLVGTALLREAQLQNLQEIPNSGMVVTMDVGDCGCIHPARKRKVGERLALLALSKSYGVNGFVPDTPVYQSMEVNNGKVYLTFDCGSEGLAPLGTTFPGFEMAGEDRIFYSATARIEKGTGRLEVSCEKVPVPVAVRYCFWNYEQGTLYSRYGIPVASFRTDTWEVKE